MDNEKSYNFKNVLCVKKETFTQAFRRLTFRFSKRELVVFLVILAATLAITIVPSLVNKTEILSKNNIIIYIIVLSGLVLISVTYLILPDIFSNLTIKRKNKLTKDDLVLETLFYDDKIVVNSTVVDQLSESTYSNVSFCTETKELLLIQMKDNHSIMLDKNGFDGISETEFKNFIKEKCQDAKLKWKMD